MNLIQFLMCIVLGGFWGGMMIGHMDFAGVLLGNILIGIGVGLTEFGEIEEEADE